MKILKAIFTWIFGVKVKFKKPVNVGRGKIKITDCDGGKSLLDIKGYWHYEFNGDTIVSRHRPVEEAFKVFVERLGNTGMVKISDNCYIERRYVRNICLVYRKDYDIYEVSYKRIRNYDGPLEVIEDRDG